MNSKQLLLNFEIGEQDNVCYWIILDILPHNKFNKDDYTYVDILSQYLSYNNYKEGILLVQNPEESSVSAFVIINPDYNKGIPMEEFKKLGQEDSNKLMQNALITSIELLNKMKENVNYLKSFRIVDGNIKLVDFGTKNDVIMIINKTIETLPTATKCYYYHLISN